MALAVFMTFAVRAGLVWTDAVAALAVIAVTQVVPGALVWRLVRPTDGWWLEDIIAGFAIGATVAVGAQAMAGWLGIAWLAWIPGILLAALLWGMPGSRRRIRSRRTTRLPPWVSLAISAVSGLLLVTVQAFYRTVPVNWGDGFRVLYVDLPFHLSLVGELANRGPVGYPFVAGETLNYHWFSHAWVAQVGNLSGAPLDSALLRVGPPVLALALVLAVAAAAIRISGRAWAGPVAALVAAATPGLTVLGGVAPFTGNRLVTSVGLSHGYSSLLLVILVLLIAIRWQHDAPAGSGSVVALLAIGAGGAKGSALPIAVSGLALALAVAVLRRTAGRRAIGIDLAITASCLLVAMAVVFGGDGRMQVDPVAAISRRSPAALLEGVGSPGVPLLMLAAALIAVGALTRAVGLAASLTVRDQRDSPVAWLLVGASLAGTAAAVLLTAGGGSEAYFLFNAQPLMAVGTAVGGVVLVSHLGPRGESLVLYGAAAGLVAIAVRAYGWSDGSAAGSAAARVALLRLAILVVIIGGFVWLANRRDRSVPLIGSAATITAAALLVFASTPSLLRFFQTGLPAGAAAVEATDLFAVSADQIEAARWLRDESERDAVVMTNRHCASPVWVNCDSRRFTIAAYSERQVLVEGWAYNPRFTRSPSNEVSREYGDAFKPFWDQELLALNDGFLTRPTAADADALRELGVTWIYIDKTADFSSRLDRYAEPRFETEWAWVLEL